MEKIKIQDARPGMYVALPEWDIYRRVTEYPITTGTGVFVQVLGDQIGPLPLDTMLDVDSDANVPF